MLLAGAVGQTAPQQDTWAEVAPPASTTFTNLSVHCLPDIVEPVELTGSAVVGSASAAAAILRLDGDPATLATNAAWTPTLTTDCTANRQQREHGQLPRGSRVPRPRPSAWPSPPAISTSPTDPTILSATIGSSGASTWSDESFPTGAASITGLSCTPTTCLAIGTTPGSPDAPPACGRATSPATPHMLGAGADRGPDGIPSSVLAATSVACGQPATGDTADCAITAATSLAAPGQLLEGSLTMGHVERGTSPHAPSGPASSTTPGLPASLPASASRSTCAAAGATANRSDHRSRPPTARRAHGRHRRLPRCPTPRASLSPPPVRRPNAAVTGIPLEITPAGQSPTGPHRWPREQHPTPANLPNVLYPYASGYSIAAGDCSAEANSTIDRLTDGATRRNGRGHRPLGAPPAAGGQCQRRTGQRSHRRDHVHLMRPPTETSTPCRSPTPTG